MSEPTPAVVACPFCFYDMPKAATVCAHCRATRRRPGARWKHYREARRADLEIAGLVVCAIVISVSVALTALGAVYVTTRPTKVSTCPVTDSRYPYC